MLIVGQGLAGTIMSARLESQGVSVCVVDNHHKGSCSVIAAGIYHPFVFKKFGFSWRASAFIPAANEFYQLLEKQLNVQFHSRENFYRIFKTIEEQNNWYAASAHPAYESYFEELSDEVIKQIKTPFGAGAATAWRVDLRVFLEAYREKLIDEKKLLSEVFDIEKLEILAGEKGFVYDQKICFDKLIYCDGHGFTKNPFFNYLPSNLTKGEIIHIASANLHTEGIVNSSCFVLSLRNGQYVVGATYNWKDLSPEITREARRELEEKLAEVSDAPYTVSNQAAGIRPTITDRRPLMGQHPEIKNIYLFNGMGSKGVMMAPLLSQQFFEHVFKGAELPYELSIERFFTRHFNAWKKPEGL